MPQKGYADEAEFGNQEFQTSMKKKNYNSSFSIQQQFTHFSKKLKFPTQV